MIEIKDLTKTFGQTRAVDNLSIALHEGVTGIVGENGAGKSTLFRLISGVYDADAGSIEIDGLPSTSKEAKQKLFFLSDTPYCPHGANPKGVADFYKGLFPLDVKKFEENLRDFGLPITNSVSTYSKGMRRQLFIALTLAMDVQYLLMDEAFDGLDPLVVEKIKGRIIEEGQNGKTILISSHNIPVLQRLVDRFILLHKGQLSKEGVNEDIGTEFVKFQAAFTVNLQENVFEALGLHVVSCKRVGSVYHIVLLESAGAEEKIRTALSPIFLEKVPIDPDELIVLEMMEANKGGDLNA